MTVLLPLLLGVVSDAGDEAAHRARLDALRARLQGEPAGVWEARCRAPETPELLRLLERTRRAVARFRAEGGERAALLERREWKMFRSARRRVFEERRAQAAQLESPKKEDAWRRTVEQAPYLYHFTHTGFLPAIARKGLTTTHQGCTFWTTAGGLPMWAQWSAGNMDHRFTLEDPGLLRKLIVLRVRRSEMDPSRMRLDAGGTKDARFYQGCVRGPASTEDAVAICYQDPVPPEALSFARVRGESVRQESIETWVVFDGPWIPVAKLVTRRG